MGIKRVASLTWNRLLMRVDNSAEKGTSGMGKFGSIIYRMNMKLGSKFLNSIRIKTQLLQRASTECLRLNEGQNPQAKLILLVRASRPLKHTKHSPCNLPSYAPPSRLFWSLLWTSTSIAPCTQKEKNTVCAWPAWIRIWSVLLGSARPNRSIETATKKARDNSCCCCGQICITNIQKESQWVISRKQRLCRHPLHLGRSCRS